MNYLYSEMLDKFYVVAAASDRSKYYLLAWENEYSQEEPVTIMEGTFGDCNDYINKKREELL